MNGKILVVILLAGLGLLFLAVAARFAGHVFPGATPPWLLFAGLASWCGSWLVASIPAP